MLLDRAFFLLKMIGELGVNWAVLALQRVSALSEVPI